MAYSSENRERGVSLYRCKTISSVKIKVLEEITFTWHNFVQLIKGRSNQTYFTTFLNHPLQFHFLLCVISCTLGKGERIEINNWVLTFLGKFGTVNG